MKAHIKIKPHTNFYNSAVVIAKGKNKGDVHCWMNKLWCSHTMEYYSPRSRNEELKCATSKHVP